MKDDWDHKLRESRRAIVGTLEAHAGGRSSARVTPQPYGAILEVGERRFEWVAYHDDSDCLAMMRLPEVIRLTVEDVTKPGHLDWLRKVVDDKVKTFGAVRPEHRDALAVAGEAVRLELSDPRYR